MLWALEELALPFELVGLDHPAHDLDTDAYRRLGPFAQVPAIDDDGLVLSESAAIVIHLAKKAGRLVPRDRAGEAQVLRWWLRGDEHGRAAAARAGAARLDVGGTHRAFLVDWSRRVRAHLERWFVGRAFVATDAVAVADLLMAHVLAFGIYDAAWIAPYPAIAAYRDRWLARPAWQRTIDADEARVRAAWTDAVAAGRRSGTPVVVGRRPRFGAGARPRNAVDVALTRPARGSPSRPPRA